MMAAILFLCLLIGSNQATAQDIEVPRDLIPKANFSEQILSSRAGLSQLEMPVYRGGVQKLINNTVAVLSESSLGAGVVLSKAAAESILPDFPKEVLEQYTMIVTNFHVVEEGVNPSVAFAPVGAMDASNAEVTDGEIISVVPTKDLALLAVEESPEHAKGVMLAKPDSARVGDDVEAVGHPNGEAWTYTRGYISQIRKNYSWSYNDSFELTADVIQTQTPISTGNSGGPLFSRDGKLLGINSFVDQGGQNLNFAVSSAQLTSLADAVQTSLEVREVSKYFNYRDLPALLSENYKLEETGVAPNGVLYQLFTLKADSDIAIMALYEDKEDSPLLAYSQHIDGRDYTIYLSTQHDNPGAYFGVMIDDEDGDTVATGWDFDGDFAVDYIR